MREKHIEETVCEYAETNGCMVRKMQYVGRRGCPDRFVFAPGGRTAIIEFKKPGGRPDPHQAREHDRFRGRGFTVHVIDNIEAGVAVIDGLVA